MTSVSFALLAVGERNSDASLQDAPQPRELASPPKPSSRICPRCGSEKMFVLRSDKKCKRTASCYSCVRERSKKWREKNRERSRTSNRLSAEQRYAHKKVENAIKRGALQRRPCEWCGTTLRVEAHHEDYTKPLDVMWLCPVHHRQRHREMRCERAG